jgi:glycosyltransferase involved in cell wall biosynthesis
MRALFLTEERISFSESLVRGGAIHVRNVVSGLRDRGHDVFLLDWNSDPERPFQVSLSPRSRFIEGPLRTTLRAIRAGRRRGVDVIVSKTRKTYLPGLVAARRLGVPHVVHVGSSLTRPVSGLANRLDTLSIQSRLRVSHDGYFVVCDHIAAQLRARDVDDERIFDVRNAVNTDRFHPTNVPEQLADEFREQVDPIDNDRLRLGFVGGLQPVKGLDDLVAALDRTVTDPVVVVAGEGPTRDRLEQAFEPDGVFLGSVPYEQVPALYHEFDAFVLPSHSEGLPRVVLEAQATATPVVATRVGGIPELITDGETGLLYNAGDVAALDDAVDRLASDTGLLTRLSEAGRAAVESEYAWGALYERYERYLREVVESHG